MTHDEILKVLSDCINDADEKELFGIGDKLLLVIHALKKDWGMDEE